MPEPELPQFSFPLQVSFKAVTDASGKWGFAEQIEFEELSSFLHYDLCHGMAAGNIPRRCECCGHYFLAIGAYDTRYCMRIAPGETVKTCRQVGAHRKEKQRNGTEFVRKEYQKVYNRLRGTTPNCLDVKAFSYTCMSTTACEAGRIGGSFR